MTGKNRISALRQRAEERILILDGAMGTALQDRKLSEADFRGTLFADHAADLKGNADVLNLTRPDVIRDIHTEYLKAGADVIETNTFSSTRVSQAEYGLEDRAYDISRAGAEIARQAADAMEKETGEPRWVAGAMGPTNKTLSVSPDINRPAFRAIGFDELKDAYKEAARGLMDGGADYLLIETIFDTLNAKAALVAVDELAEETGKPVPVALSLTVTDLSGRTLSGQTVEAFWNSVRHVRPLTIGLNCAFGAQDLRPFIRELSGLADTLLCAYPNAGLPNELGDYTETPDITASELGDWAASGYLNIVGGCCGTTPAHIRAIKEAVEGAPPRDIPDPGPALRLSGLEPLVVRA